MRVKIWGIRGSYPVSGEKFNKYGGHTTCSQIDTRDGQRILLDAGTGIIPYEKENPDSDFTLLLSHLHIDHLQGLMFLSRMYRDPPVIYAPVFREDPAEYLPRLFDGAIFPVRWQDMPPCQIKSFRPGDKLQIGNAMIETMTTNHPGGCVSYKIRCDNDILAFSGDHEIPLASMRTEAFENNERLMDFLAGSDFAVVDGTYFKEDHLAHPGWGHSHFEQWTSALASKDIKRIMFAHYNPGYSDGFLDKIIEDMRGLARGVEVSAGYEGLAVEIGRN